MATFTQMGSITNTPATMTSSANPSMVMFHNLYGDDESTYVNLPFTLQFYNNLMSGWYVGSNSYITMNSQTSYLLVPTDDVGIFIQSKDNSYDYVGGLTSTDGNSFTIHFEGNAQSSDGSNDLWWDCTFFKDGVIQIVIAPAPNFKADVINNTYSLLSNKTGIAECDFIPVAGQSYVFIPNSDFSAYTVTTGVSYTYAPATNNYSPTIPTSLNTSINGAITTFSGILHDQDGGANYLVVDYSTSSSFTTFTTVTSVYTSVETTASVASSSLSPSTTYYWRARGYDGTNYSPYSSTMNFVTTRLAPPVLSNFSPDSQSRLSSPSSTNLSAKVISPNSVSSTLTFQITQDVTFATGIVSLTASNINSGSIGTVTTSTLTYGTWYWRVQATDSNNLTSYWSNIYALYVNNTTSENLSPTTIITETNFTGAVTSIQDSPSSPDANWITTTTAGTSATLVTSFNVPSNPLISGSSTQKFNVYAKKTNTNGNPSLTIALVEYGIGLITGSAQSITSTTGQTVSFTWDSGLLTDYTGKGAQLQVVTTPYIGSGTKKTDISIGAIQWATNELLSPTVVPTPSDSTPPQEIMNQSSTSSAYSTTLSWTNPLDYDFRCVNIYRDGSKITSFFGSSYTDNSVTANTSYTYKITTVDFGGNESSGTTINISTIADVTPPSNITDLSATETPTSVSLSWINPTDFDFDHVNIYRNSTLIGSSNTNSNYDLGLAESTQYTYKITSVDRAGNESTGDSITVSTPSSSNSPQVMSLTASRYRISAFQGDNISNVTFSFDSPIKSYSLNINGTSYDSGIVLSSGNLGQTVSALSGNTVQSLQSDTVQGLLFSPSGSQISVAIDNTEIPAEGSYRVNVYGQSNINSTWTPYGN